MIIKLNPIFPVYARHRAESKLSIPTTFTHKQWIKIDRIVIALLFITAIILAVVFS